MAASHGLKGDEKTAITRQSPSHGGLLSALTDATGMLAYVLPSGRYCISHSSYAGTEHTARGGQRIVTHVVALSESDYRYFGGNPVRVHRVLGKTSTFDPATPPQRTLEQLQLTVDAGPGPAPVLIAPSAIDVFIRLVSTILGSGKCVIGGVDNPIPMLEWALEMVPFSTRSKVSISTGLTFSLARKLEFTLIPQPGPEILRSIKGHDIHCRDLSSPVDYPESSAYREWLMLVRQWVSKGALQDIRRMTACILGTNEPEALRRVAQLCTDTELCRSADKNMQDCLRSKYSAFVPDNDLEKELRKKILAMLAVDDQQIVSAPPPQLQQQPARIQSPG